MSHGAARTITAARLNASFSRPARICVLEGLQGMVRDLLAVSPAEARSLGKRLIELADEADIETTGGVPPTEGESNG